jgi:hypothetical protein
VLPLLAGGPVVNGEKSSKEESPPPALTCRCIDWFAEGEAKTVEVDGIRVIVRFIGRKGRRGRIAIEAPAGAEFLSDSPMSESM